MDQIKVGKFIAACRKEQGMTQANLAEKLGISDRAVSKWETGKSMPDSGIMLELCELLKITVNDLLSGETVSMNNQNKVSENILIEIVGQKEAADKRLMLMEIVISLISIAFFFSMITIASLIQMQERAKGLIIGIGIAQLILVGLVATRIEQVVGYYECAKCGNKYVPKYSSVNFAMHIGRTRYMKCPCCGKKSWQKKVLSKETLQKQKSTVD